MEYDRLCEAAERHFPEWVPAVNEARIFCMDMAALDRWDVPLDKWHPDEQLAENFRLPFDAVAINIDGSCAVLKTISQEQRTFRVFGASHSGKQPDLFTARVRAFPAGLLADEAGSRGRICAVEDYRVWRQVGGKLDECLFYMNEVTLNEQMLRQQSDDHKAKSWLDVEVKPDIKTMTCTIDGEQVKPSLKNAIEAREILDGQIRGMNDHLGVMSANRCFIEISRAILCVAAICEPSKFVVEERPVSLADKQAKPGKCLRSPYRPRYIVLSPGEIKKRYLYEDHETAQIPKAPHERRGHYRRLMSEHYKNRRGEVLWIKPCWVGKTEGVRGKNRYRVILEA